MADECADKVDAKFIESNCSEYDLPCMDFYVHAPDYE